ncbi:MAG: DNA-binding protein [Roseiflexus sp.]|nr:DNA-binding protein [Roseiflexus sp.]MDW8231978.1 iron dependent repressor, metal binding and dimerization domain protein [Roseiflexaceae bacterium]
MTSRVVYLTGADGIDDHTSERDGLERACLEVVAVLSERREPVVTPQVVHWMRARALAPSIVLALRQLEQKGLIRRDDANIVHLTDEGAAAGAQILRRRRLLERFLNDTLKVPWHEVYREAKHLEPVLSPVMEARIEALTEQATTCPYGNPIPGRSETHPNEQRLITAPVDAWFIISRIDEEAGEDSCALQFLWTRGLRPGTPLIRRPDAPDGLVVQRADRRIVLSRRIARFLWGRSKL